jgi:hypothetical protein
MFLMKNLLKNNAQISEATDPTMRFETVNSNVSISQKISDNINNVTYLISLT